MNLDSAVDFINQLKEHVDFYRYEMEILKQRLEQNDQLLSAYKATLAKKEIEIKSLKNDLEQSKANQCKCSSDPFEQARPKEESKVDETEKLQYDVINAFDIVLESMLDRSKSQINLSAKDQRTKDLIELASMLRKK